MTTPLILLILLGGGALLWSAARDAEAVARAAARGICERSGVQLLDQSVALRSVRLRRDDEGRMRLQRTYRFEYSSSGHDREFGEIALLGDRVLWSSGP